MSMDNMVEVQGLDLGLSRHRRLGQDRHLTSPI